MADVPEMPVPWLKVFVHLDLQALDNWKRAYPNLDVLRRIANYRGRTEPVLLLLERVLNDLWLPKLKAQSTISDALADPSLDAANSARCQYKLQDINNILQAQGRDQINLDSTFSQIRILMRELKALLAPEVVFNNAGRAIYAAVE